MKEKTLHKDNRSNSGQEPVSLILFNDNVNTFDFVIKSLVEICGHDAIQAEQCALIVHFKGSCEVKTGGSDLMNSMCRLLIEKGLDSKVELSW